jgi:hypothetical protein
MLSEIFKLVKDHMGWDDDKTSLWFTMPNPHIGNLSPLMYWSFKPEKCERWIKSLIEESSPP